MTDSTSHPVPEGDTPETPLHEESSLFPPYLSPSQINSLLLCGEQFRLQRVARVPQRPMYGGIGGRVVHTLTEEIDRVFFAAQCKYDTEDELSEAATRPAVDKSAPQFLNTDEEQA